MKKNKNLLIAILMMIIGFVFNGLAWSTIIGVHPYNTICFLLGLGLSLFGLIFFILSLVKK
jgi:hypothetical protein